MREARIRTCTRNPHLRLVFVTMGRMLRNLWVSIHADILAQRQGDLRVVRLHLLRFKRLLDWITQSIVAQLHDGAIACVAYAP